MVFKQLSCLSTEAEGRYATPQELQFVREYRQTWELRLSTYNKIKDAETQIIDSVVQKSHQKDPKLFYMGSRDVTSLCKRDIQLVLRASALAMLTDDLERLRDNLLLWQKTVVKALDHQSYILIVYKIIPEVVREFLTEEEAELIIPALTLSLTVLAD